MVNLPDLRTQPTIWEVLFSLSEARLSLAVVMCRPRDVTLFGRSGDLVFFPHDAQTSAAAGPPYHNQHLAVTNFQQVGQGLNNYIIKSSSVSIFLQGHILILTYFI